MKTQNLNRLKKLVKNLEAMGNEYPNKQYESGENGMSIEHYHWALEPIYDQLKKQDGSGLRKNEILYKVAAYFKLSVDEVFHLFVPGYQEAYLDGQLLDEKATPKQLAQNILAFVKIKEADSYESVVCKINKKEKQVRVLTFKPNYHEERQYANYMS